MRRTRSLQGLFLLAVFAWLTVGLGAAEPEFEYGGIEDFKDVSRIYIDTGTRLNLRNEIADRIRKKIPHLVVTNKPDEAELILDFTLDKRRGFSADGIMVQLGAGSGGPAYFGVSLASSLMTTDQEGHGLVYRQLEENKIRILMEFSGSKKFLFQSSPVKKFAKQFIRAYSEVNSIK